MKKLLVAVVCFCVTFLAGCSGVTYEEFTSAIDENSRLKDEKDEMWKDNFKLAKEIENLRSEKAELEKKLENNDNQDLSTDNIDVDVLSWIMARPQSTVISSEISSEEDWLTTENTYFSENSDISVKIVHTISSSVSAEKISSFIHSYEIKQAAAVPEMFSKQSGLVELMVIYRYDDGKIIMSTCWYNYQNNTITYGYSWGRYGEDVKKEYSK